MSPLRASHHDVVVVGARCAGAATALLLARAGHDVALLDRARLPSDTTSTHSLVRGGVVQLSRWGLLDEVLATGAPAIRSVEFHRYGAGAPHPVRLPVKDRAGVDHMLAPRRHVLDRVLADAAVRAGVSLVDRTTVDGLVRDDHGAVRGVTTRADDGTRGALTARLVVGADGVRSRIAQLVGAPLVESHGASGACLYTYVGGVPWDGFEFHLGDRAFAGVFPTHAGEACVWLIRPEQLAAPVLSAGADRLAAWTAALDATVPGLARRVGAGSVTAPLRGAVRLPNHRRRATGPGWALVGDAGYHRDPITGHGMTDAFRDADLLAHAADSALRDRHHAAPTLHDFEAQRDRALADTFRLTRALAAFPPHERFVELQGELGRALDAEARFLAERGPLTAAVPVP